MILICVRVIFSQTKGGLMFKCHIAVGVLLLALAAGCHLICRSACPKDECTPSCKKVGKVVGVLISLIALLSLICSLYSGLSGMCCDKKSHKTCPHHNPQLEEGATESPEVAK
ncbi:MAG: hypothetical protein A3B79_02705 [Deltaproteobacteria bacterium RIFCSPHIGHO2_02_FULL_50_15]|nr:MAG: hypothetical protein A3B79_02705 [Deltaproteobacteria bacterium RIFCSPHIGHO2_02_FULL_50_15]